MMRKTGFHLLALALLALGNVPAAFGWGSYGHQQINVGALELIKGTVLGKCLKLNEKVVQRLSVTPDVDWKAGPKDKELPEDEYKAKQAIDRDEHSLHFFEEDAYKSTPETKLPSGAFKDGVPELERLLGENADHIAEVDPSKKLKDPEHPTLDDVTKHGTAPWRSLQLYDLAVAALKAGEVSKAIFYLGTMGHYVGDMSQPFHATLDFDGQASDAKGIHHVFEEAILETAAKGADAHLDHDTRLWSSFEATHDEVVATARRELAAAGGVAREKIISEITRLLDTGQAYIAPLTEAFSKENRAYCEAQLNEKKQSKHEKIAQAVITAFMGLSLPDPVHESRQSSVLGIANARMGESSALVARMWTSAFEAAGSPALNCSKISFESLDVVKNYPRPTYIPGVK
ncbi:MAG: hypothetical protein HY075_05585 [Deltaproteobacteria bacterium]|nr:hypothetical protein [Deltaproteobacteria bacterium]